MLWDRLGWCAIALGCVACGESSGNKPNTATGGTSGGGAGNSGKAGSSNSAAGVSGNASAGSAGETSVGVGMCRGSTNQTGGTRLKGRFWVTAEGDRAWDTWWDTELDIACDFNSAADGVMRCLPDNWDDSQEVFTDALCTQPLYTRMSIGPCEPIDYIMRVGSGTCEMPSGDRFFELGAAATPGSVFTKTGADCVASALPKEPLYAKGPEVPPAMFMGSTPAEFGADTRIRTRGVLGTDGTKQVFGWRDTQLAGEDCYFETAEDGKSRCLPGGLQSAGYNDAACSMPVLQLTPRCDQKVPSYSLQSSGDGCATDYRVFKRGEAVSGTRYVGTPENCAAGPPLEGSMLFQSLPAPPETFQEVTPTIAQNDPGRLKARYRDAGDVGCWFHNFWDDELKQICSFLTASDEKQRCLPSTAISVLQTFSDAACTVPAALSAIDECTPTTPPEYSTNEMPGECGRRHYQVWKVGEQVAGADLPPLWRDWGAEVGCIAFQPSIGNYLKLTLVDPTVFMAGEPMVDP